jgi:hypothetical protein
LSKYKKILLVGHFGEDPKLYTYASSFYTALQKLGLSVIKFEYRRKYFGRTYSGFINTLLMNMALKKEAKKVGADCVLVIKGENILPKTLLWLQEKLHAKLFNFYPDNPFTLWNGNSNIHVLNSLPIYDRVLIWSKQLVQILLAAGCNKVGYFPFAVDEELFSQNILSDEDSKRKYACDVCFVGTWDAEREQWLTTLLQETPNLNLGLWGNDWHKNLKTDSPLRQRLRGYAVYGTEMIKLFRSSKIVLNFIRKQNLDAHNMRTFEVPASKAFLLTQRTTEQASELFKETESIACFGSVSELAMRIKFYTANEKERIKLIDNGYEVVKKFTLQKQLKKLFT